MLLLTEKKIKSWKYCHERALSNKLKYSGQKKYSSKYVVCSMFYVVNQTYIETYDFLISSFILLYN